MTAGSALVTALCTRTLWTSFVLKLTLHKERPPPHRHCPFHVLKPWKSSAATLGLAKFALSISVWTVWHLLCFVGPHGVRAVRQVRVIPDLYPDFPHWIRTCHELPWATAADPPPRRTVGDEKLPAHPSPASNAASSKLPIALTRFQPAECSCVFVTQYVESQIIGTKISKIGPEWISACSYSLRGFIPSCLFQRPKWE